MMDEAKAQAFRETLQTYRELILRGVELSPEEKMWMLERLQDTWYQPLCFAYNLMAPFEYPKYIKNQMQQAREVPEGVIFLWIHMHYGEWLYRDKLEMAMVHVED